MKCALAVVVALAASCPLAAELKSGPSLPYQVVKDWAQLPAGWNFGECSGVAVDRQDNVWVFNRGPHPVIEFDRNGNMLQSWGEGTVKSSHGIRVDAEGNVWGVDVKGHVILKYSPSGRVLMILGNRQGYPGNNDSKDAFAEPTNIAFAPNGDFFISDGYVNSRVIKFNKDGEYLTHWGRKGTGDGEFNLVHDVVLDKRGHVYVADRTNQRVQIFDGNGKFLGKWTDIGAPWGLDYVPREDAIYMCDGLNNRVIKLNTDGQVLGVLGSYGKIPGRFDFAHSIAVDSTGAIYVAEIKNWRVQKFVKTTSGAAAHSSGAN
ncbi:MAG TPA: peptidyl-alpha-hydroxyglycine alpha-amidating lyase family protein [Bryobacteraceae bacterium]|nr:peptidyl-alpha-hydroxyglycine alpha-amidating lyase family protein [Bryobacteraceae bacterium]